MKLESALERKRAKQRRGRFIVFHDFALRRIGGGMRDRVGGWGGQAKGGEGLFVSIDSRGREKGKMMVSSLRSFDQHANKTNLFFSQLRRSRGTGSLPNLKIWIGLTPATLASRSNSYSWSFLPHCIYSTYQPPSYKSTPCSFPLR